MKLHLLPLSVILGAVTAFAVKIPVKKVRRSPLERRSGTGDLAAAHPLAVLANTHVLVASSSSNTSDLSTVNDMIYIANITLGGNDYRVQLDTGSSDLWIKGSTSPLPNANQTSTTYNLTYGIGWAYGHVSYASAKFAGISVPQQAYLDVSSAENPALSYGTNGILGLGFTSLSTVDALVNKTGASTGRSLLYNLFNDNPTEPNFVAFSLQRSLDPTDDIEGTFLVGEVEPQYIAVNQTTAIPTFPANSPTRWTVLLDALMVGTDTIEVTSTVSGAPFNRAVVLVDSGTSYTYAPTEICDAIYGGVSGAKYDSSLGQWTLPCDAEIDMALQFSGQVYPIHPLDVSPTSLASNSSCVGSFVPQDISSIELTAVVLVSDWIIGDNFLRSVYSVYDFGDFDSSGKMGNPYIKLLSLVDPDAASADFASARGTTARNNITYNASNSTISSGTTVSLSDDITNTLKKVSVYFPAMLAIMALNAFVMLLLVIVGLVFLCRRSRGGPRSRKNKGRSTPLPLEPLSTGIASFEQDSMQHVYQPVSMALTEDTFVPPSPAFHGYEGKGKQVVDRPKSVA
ncbi:hypothetical protein EW146_g1452 [Bondarzewia mesenterica]|uniref:Peptidase A1 domain-containing protein n=1 Tax=Bondarzewia mesenterica TaxID=1095465 RepID=A0A4S4M3N6_9AGAM|nr:hypothetical protein EW146_g1452 [Bondarzewia mesenterica]